MATTEKKERAPKDGWKLFESKYVDTYPQLLLDMFSRGQTRSHFCAHVKIGIQTFYDWLDYHPEFRHAYGIATQIAESILMEKAHTGMMLGQFNSTVWSMLARNQCGLTEHRKVQIDFTDCKTPMDEIRKLKREVARGSLTSREAKDLIDVVVAGLTINERTTLAADIAEIKEMVGKK